MASIYLYGIIEGMAEVDLGIAGVDGASPVYTVAGDGLGCVVSDYEGPGFGALSKEALLRSLVAHQRVAEKAMQLHYHTVVPIKFGTLLNGGQAVRELLTQGHSVFRGALASMRDKVEIEVAATWEIKRALQEVGQEEEVARAREAIAPGGSATLEDKVHLGQVVKACLDRRRDAYRERMVEVLRPLAVGVAPNALVAEEMVMNVAFLVERERQREFDERVRELDSLFDDEVTFRVIGPLPPYSFSAVEVTRLSDVQIEEARQELELPDTFSETEVRRAYRRLAAREQRKALPGATVTADRLARVRQASEVLLACCGAQALQSYGGPLGGNEKSLFVIAVRGTGHQEIDAARFGGAIRV